MNQRRVVLYIAQSVDGFIARADGDIEWLASVEMENEDYGYGAFVRTVDTVIMGRKTYEKVMSLDVPFPHKGRKCYVISKSRSGSDDNVEFYGGDVETLIQQLKREGGGTIYIDGGSEVVQLLRTADLIDEYVLSIIPVMLGKGIPLFRITDTENALELQEAKAFKSGLVQLKYNRRQ